MHGVLLVDKPSGPTSFDIVKAVRRLAGTRKVGHAGTLDPLASGLLAVCVGAGTKLVPYLLEHPKRYLATVALGAETDTDDCTGETTEEGDVPALTPDAVERAAQGFVGTIEQVPPAFSALKQDGEPLYRKARRGDEVRPAARQVTIHEIHVRRVEDAELALEVSCAKGTYIRSLARDLGRALGTHGHLSALRRTRCSGFSVDEARTVGALERCAEEGSLGEALTPLGLALRGAPRVVLSAAEQVAIGHGQAIPGTEPVTEGDPVAQGVICLVDDGGALHGIGRLDGELIKPVRVFPER